MDRRAAIERNRRKLLALVSCWLMVALAVRLTRLVLPLRVAKWTSRNLWKAEAAVGFLIQLSKETGVSGDVPNAVDYLAKALIFQSSRSGWETELEMSVEAVIRRLRALKKALKRLAPSLIVPKPKICRVPRGVFKMPKFSWRPSMCNASLVPP